MNRLQIALVLGGMILVFLLYQLPRVVVENETEADVETHDFSVSQEDELAIASLRTESKRDSENYLNFADSLAGYYLKYGLLDSAVNVSRRTLRKDSSLQNLKRVALIHYRAFERYTDPDRVRQVGTEAKELLELLVGSYPGDLSLRTKLAMTIVATQSPMAGVQMLQEVVNIDPTYREAIVNLGLLSVQSGQYERGIDRFSGLLQRDSLDYEVMLYLGVCYLETDQSVKARKLFEEIVEAPEADPALRATAQQYLE